MWFLYCLSWFSLFIQASFGTLAIACGLFYLAELIEEYTVMSFQVIKYILVTVTCIQSCFFIFEELPISLVVCGLICNISYFILLRTFPIFYLSSPSFIVSIALLILHHYFAFKHFSSVWYEFTQVLAYFTICLWIVPFILLVSLSANDNVLPTTMAHIDVQSSTSPDDIVTSYFRNKTKRLGLLSFLRNAQDSILPQRIKKGF